MMIRLLLGVAILAPVVLRANEATRTTVCAVTSNPKAHSGKTVSVWAHVVVDYHGTFIAQRGCKKMLPLVLPEGSVQNRRVEVRADETYERFKRALYDYRPGTSELRKRIEARFEGRFELIPEDSQGVLGPPGPALGARWQFVLERVSDVLLK